jgi:hypothetical protein
MTSPTSEPIDAELLLEMLFRADKALNETAGKFRQIGLVALSSTERDLCVVYNGQGRRAFTYWKPLTGSEPLSFRTIEARCDWTPSLFWPALKALREAQILDDLAELHD